MIKLCGFSASNYYNKVKFVLLEKDIPFEEVHVLFSPPDALLGRSALGKIPFIETDEGVLTESQVIVDYLEAAYPQNPLLPADPFAAAQQRELITYLEMHIELVARDLYRHAFSGLPISDETRERVHKALSHNLAGFKRLAHFAPYLGGETFTLADLVAYLHLPIVSMASKVVYGSDIVDEAGIDWKSHGKLIAERPAAQKVVADRKAYLAARKAEAGG
jgi:glutathione S-transferase